MENETIAFILILFIVNNVVLLSLFFSLNDRVSVLLECFSEHLNNHIKRETKESFDIFENIVKSFFSKKK